jgi:DNA polymerase IV (DinB-like DNA polymerase)
LFAAGGNDISQKRIVMHIDFDYFYAQCEEIRNHSLRSVPVVVCVFSGRTEDSGVVSTANYVARKQGVKSGIPIKVAKSRLADNKEAVFLPVDMQYYSAISDRAMALIESAADKFEKTGIDECFIDVSGSVGTFIEAKKLAEKIRANVKAEVALTCSIGVAPNKTIAKIASDYVKPDGLTVVEPSSVQQFISGLTVDKISGIGPKTRTRLGDMGVRTVSDLTRIDRFRLIEEFGKKTGTFIYDSARGIDEDPVEDRRERKQIARIVTLKKDASASPEMLPDLAGLCRSVFDSAARNNIAFKTIGVFVILDDLDERSKSKSLRVHASSYDILHSTARALLEQLMGSEGALRVRRLGVRLSDLQDAAGQNTMSQFMNG